MRARRRLAATARRDAPLWLWGLRAGCLLAARRPPAASTAPATCCSGSRRRAGKLLLQQFLRLRAVAEMIDGEAARGATAALRRTLADGQPVDVAGYRLPPALAAGLDAAVLRPSSNVGRLVWFEVSSLAGPRRRRR